ncbi:MAG: hypothetical protein COV55_03185 [Candidatus Komeilibacteria bacterium CG11_big_fil_rev_8_21_14_0_20_36_20]|uniref:Uncharacterized protein n=1 Tax=Candidatus Komeilibacteria bacterium CG11_big_fil_rev_8_21_14_0_20_36_20 TaxID=1974477 RepID=A0A2H0NEA8_9BACT|nr:MAG: hypothetical protein COV55_03185 [Candidatus Komeilibacteria bacterium CG11_big_fil_rev_8_21_14_0_20_36_20]PIR81778.1 MAG: hypothetical protein COU21_01925 [Candidatus Komeilibacteria bacterium CG10_big_fil_rev_8_21_14_0_10_36_65]PJC55801.1 MAG: hypothetical protein CO027_00105 [Candidatus Komeilibacteria bacterium CG_4_9_14_0_2_um_filter_36_13]
MPKYYKKENILCFSKKELYNLIKIQKIPRLRQIISENSLTLDDVKNNTHKAEEAFDPPIKKNG